MNENDHCIDHGCFDQNLQLSGIGIRYKNDKSSNVESYSFGKWTNGVLNGEGLRQYQKSHDQQISLPDDEFGDFIDDKF